MTFPRTNHANQAFRYCIFFCNILLQFSGIRAGFYVGNLFVSKFAARVISSAPLGNHVDNVVTIRPQEQVRWVDALRVITRMANAHFWWNWPVYKLPCYTVSEVRFPSIFKLAICPPRLSGVFNTTVAALFASFLKSSFHGNFPCWNSALAFCGARPRAQPLPSDNCRRGVESERLSADFTNFGCCSHGTV